LVILQDYSLRCAIHPRFEKQSFLAIFSVKKLRNLGVDFAQGYYFEKPKIIV
jgi:hypothetical protein